MPVAKSSSKTPIVVLVVVLVLAAVGVGAWFLVNRSLGNPSVEDLVELMPADATAVVLVRGLPKLALDFRLEEHFETLERENEDFRRFLEEMRAELGFDPTDREAMDEQGFDLLAPLGAVFTLNPDQSWNVAGFLPVSDPEKVDAAIRRHAEQAGQPVRDVTFEGSTFAATGDGRAWAIVGQGRVGWWRDGARGFEVLPPSALTASDWHCTPSRSCVYTATSEPARPREAPLPPRPTTRSSDRPRSVRCAGARSAPSTRPSVPPTSLRHPRRTSCVTGGPGVVPVASGDDERPGPHGTGPLG